MDRLCHLREKRLFMARMHAPFSALVQCFLERANGRFGAGRDATKPWCTLKADAIGATVEMAAKSAARGLDGALDGPRVHHSDQDID